MEEKPELLQLYELQYSDLILLSSNKSPPSTEEIRRMESVSETVMQTLGPTGPGLLSIVGVPKASILRKTLLPLARKLSLLNNDDRKLVLKEHNLGSDVPLKDLDRIVSSFAMQMKYEQRTSDGVNKKMEGKFEDEEFKNLGSVFKELGFCMMELGLCLAQICDKVIGGHELEQSLLQSGTAKGRLIHYHSPIDNFFIKEAAKRKGPRISEVNLGNEVKLCDDKKLDLWQQWHYDYGIFTVLTAPMFMLSNSNHELEYENPSDHTYLQILDPEKNRVLMVKASMESFIFQVGESADVLSKGMLRATLHCVCRPKKMKNLSRETFVVFLQPAWSKTFHLSDHPMERLTSSSQDSESCTEGTHGAEKDSNGLTQNSLQLVPPLHSRLKDGMTFAEFSRVTTKQYYGSSGLQPNR
ncbi:2-oxoglutarate (2OG) and Fe(II)-dependent oxygenase superfamily protein [Abeliophyllum distichum]|uniref:2-oxoglutarate (2OG) and Fe(II)-dependent oxygenase superfamily protein n=1 Tax=Abeliophyllum distichum TaxID=126358 RepID=A0ABD1TDB3_9LAMI